jgi:hypothetical protein
MSGESFYKPSAALDLMADLGRIPGGCEDCDAYQTVEPTEPGVYKLTVHHDASCPHYRQIVARRAEAS